MILYHIMADTGCLPDDVVPQIPTNRMKGEDQEIPRICLGHTLDDCLTSIGIAHFVSKFLLAELRHLAGPGISESNHGYHSEMA